MTRSMLTKFQREMLSHAAAIGGWTVNTENLVAVADLVKRGYAYLTDDNEGSVSFHATDAGINYALKAKLIEPMREPGGWGRPYVYGAAAMKILGKTK